MTALEVNEAHILGNVKRAWHDAEHAVGEAFAVLTPPYAHELAIFLESSCERQIRLARKLLDEAA
jgi:hypothetical protein